VLTPSRATQGQFMPCYQVSIFADNRVSPPRDELLPSSQGLGALKVDVITVDMQ